MNTTPGPWKKMVVVPKAIFTILTPTKAARVLRESSPVLDIITYRIGRQYVQLKKLSSKIVISRHVLSYYQYLIEPSQVLSSSSSQSCASPRWSVSGGTCDAPPPFSGSSGHRW